MAELGENLRKFSRLFDLDGKRALVVGAGSGIGALVAQGLAAFGARVVCADLMVDTAESTARIISEAGGTASWFQVDIVQRGSVAELAKAHNDTDILVLTAGIHRRKAITELTEEDIAQVLGVNLVGSFWVMRDFGEQMANRGKGGAIVAIASIRASVVEPGTSVYGASKAGLLQMVRSVAAEFGPYRVRANAISPAPIETPMVSSVVSTPEWYDAYAQKTVFRRWGRPEELVGAVIYLCSEASSFVTGSELMVDGGWTAADGRFDPPLPNGLKAERNV